MAGGLVVHIASGADRHTEVLSQDRVRIGPGEDCHVRLRSSQLPADSFVALELQRTNGHYRVAEFDPALGITHNGAPLASGAVVDDGDELRFADSDLALQFFPVRDLPAVVSHRRAVVAPFIEQAAIEAAATARRDDAKVFLREFTRELIREINVSTKIITLLIVVSLVGGILYLGFAGYRELRRSRDLIDKQNEQLALMKESVGRQAEQFEEVDKKNRDIIDSLSLAPRIRSQYGDGVCLITGTYVLVEAKTGRPLRYTEPQAVSGDDAASLQPGEAQPMLSPDGNGAPYVADFVGTGFHAGGGYIITNRHLVAEPWTANPNVQTLSASVRGKFRVTRLLAFFPGKRHPFALRLKQTSPRDDLAVCLIEKDMPEDIPALPLDKSGDAAAVGKSVVMMGYPNGEERLLAMLPEAEARTIAQRYSATMETLFTHLAERNYIKPLTTQGHITDIDARSIVYDARNAVGGSGSPLFGQSGRVIGVNYATYTGMADTNLAVPVSVLFPVLERAGWKAVDPAPADPANSGNANNAAPKDQRATSPANQPRQP